MQKIIEKTKQAINNIATTDPTKVTDLRGPTMTMRNGAPIPSDMMSQTAGPGGPILLQDIYYVEKQAAHNRERIPERVVHAKGAGAYGTFTVTGDITKFTMADLFSSVGKETPVFVRFSRAAGGSDSADTARDVRGFAVKFYTNEGNWDLAGNNHPVFFVRDPIKFMDVIHTLQKDPRNGTGSPIPMWDFFSNTPESLHHVTMFFSDKGTPMSYRTMDGFGANTFSFINKEGEVHFFKIHMITEQGNKVFTKEQAGMIAGQDPDFYSRDLFEAITEKNYPKWKVYVQVMTPDQARQYPPAFDVTKVWNHDDFPLIEVGMLELNRNPTDFFAEVEQAAFAPSNVVPGISFSPDRILQGRLFAYPDTQRYRIGVNYPYLPVNCPHFSRITSNQKDGRMLPVVENKFPHYYPNTLSGPSEGDHMPEVALPLKEQAVTGRFNPGPLVPLSEDEDFFKQPRDLFNLLPQDAKERLADNIATSLETVPENIVKKQMELFFKCDEQYGRMVQDFLQRRKKGDMQRTEAEWVKSASLVLLKNPNMKDDLLPQGPIGTWPKQYQKFELKSSYESETVPASAPSLTEKLSEKLTGLAK